MANDEDWVTDVRRWYFGGHPPEGELAADGSEGHEELAAGYEAAAAVPVSLTARWPDTLEPGLR